MNNKNDRGALPEHSMQERFIEAPETRLVLEKKMVGKFKPSSTTPDVKNVEFWRAANTGAVTVTDFLNGQEGQHLYIVGDGNTTLQQGTNIENQGGANLLLTAAKMYHYVYISDSAGTAKWRQI